MTGTLLASSSPEESLLNTFSQRLSFLYARFPKLV
jgi:hypothetical protein